MTASPKRTLLRTLLPILLVWLAACSSEEMQEAEPWVFTAPKPEVAETASGAVEDTDSEQGDEPAPPEEAADPLGKTASPKVAAGSPQENYAVTPLADVHVCGGTMKRSSLTFVSSKDDGVKVRGVFDVSLGGFHLDPTDLSGMTGQLNVRLETVDTGNEVRDKNISTTLFGWAAGKTVRADVEFLKVTPSVKVLGVGKSTTGVAELRINVGGQGSLARVPVGLSRPSAEEWVLKTVDPLSLSLRDLGLQEQADALKKVCGHRLIGDHVEIEASVHLVPTR